MALGIKAATSPVNSAFLLAGVCGLATWALWPTPSTPWQMYTVIVPVGLAAVFGAKTGIELLIRDYRLRRDLARSLEISDDHGSARQATWDEIVARGMHLPGSGNFIGLYAGKYPVFSPKRSPFAYVEMPPGVGKTVNYVLGSILHRARLGYSLVIADVKQELGPMLIPALRDQGFEVWAVHPTGEFADLAQPVEFNLYQPVIDACYAEDDTRLDAIKIAADIATVHYPSEPGEKNPYFANGSRRSIAFAILALALTDPGSCTPAGVFELLNNPQRLQELLRFVCDHLDTGRESDPLLVHLRGEAATLLHRSEKLEENFAAFLEGATQRLLPFSPGGRLGTYGQSAVHSIAELRERQIVLFIMTPLSHLRDFSVFVSLLNYNVLAAAKQNPTGHRVHLVAEEALNYRFNELVSEMETLRGLSVSADFYLQSYAGLERQYGKQAAEAIESYSDVKIYAGLNSLARAKHVSELLSEGTIRKLDYSYKAVAQDVGISSGEMGRRLMQPDEVLSMDRNTAWVFVRGMRPMLLTMAHYGQVSPWRDQVGDNPLEGTRLRADALFHIDYPKEDSDDR